MQIYLEGDILMNRNGFTGENTRRYYRVQYPDLIRPRLRTEKGTFLIKSLSERSGHFIIEDETMVVPDETIYGDITFHNGETTFIDGRVLRALGDGFILFFSIGIPLKIIVNEQRYLITQYRHLENG